MRQIASQNANGTQLMGYVDASYEELVRAFGEPNGQTDGYKVDVEWVLKDGAHVITIYNYKTGPSYTGCDREMWIQTERDWHIGGHSPKAVQAVKKIFPNARVG